MQLVRMRRTPRIPLMLEARRKGSISMFISRAKTPAVLPLWIVLITEMPGQTRLNRDCSSLRIPNFPDHDNLRVLSH